MKTKQKLSLVIISLMALYGGLLMAQNNKRPNINYIMTDDQSAIVPVKEDGNKVHLEGEKVQSHPFGFNGDKEVHTPIIDGLAKGGMIADLIAILGSFDIVLGEVDR